VANKSFFLVLISFLFSFSVWAASTGEGGWHSSGGEVFKNEKNPWFVKNTQQVNYCVVFSQDDFSIRSEVAIPLIDQSMQYWKQQLDGQSAISIERPGNGLTEKTFQVATQTFKFNPTCQGSEDLVFKFGYGALDKEEVAYMVTPENYLGLAIRKTYDEANLKGKGIIYISGDIGKHPYKKTSKDAIDQAWQYSKLLQYVLLHELGHVFGLPHSGSGLMSEVFLDQLLIRKFAALYVREPISTFIKPADSAEICDASVMPAGSQTFLASYFSLVYKEDCLKLQLADNKKEFSILTKKLTQDQTAWKKIGTLFIDRNELVDYSLKPAMILQLTDDQKVFQFVDSSFLMGPVFQNYKVDGHITFGTSMKPFPVQIDLSPDAIVVYGTADNRIRQIFSYGNPLLYSLTNPF